MRTRTMVIGLVVLVIGIALIAGGVIGLRGNTTRITTFTQTATGEYVSAPIDLNSTSVVVVRSPATVGGLIAAKDVGLVSSANIASYAVAYNSSAAGSYSYVGIKGNYSYVAFTSSAPATSILVEAGLVRAIASGLLALIGFICLIAGIIVVIIGAVRKGPGSQKPEKSEKSMDDEYYAKRGTGPASPQS